MPDSRQTILGSRLYKGASASASLYLKWSCADLIASGALVELSPTVFRHGDTVIVIRHLSGLASVPEHSKLIYVIDDDWRAGLSDASLPATYRLQLAMEFKRVAPKLEHNASTILAASEYLTDQYRTRYPEKTVTPISPAWPEATSDLAQETPRRLAYLSAATHRKDSKFLAPVLDALLGTHPDLSLTLSHAFAVPGEWKGKKNVTILPQMGWSAYLDWMNGQRFDLLLYPLMDTPFNAARSSNKLFESDQLGAALIASETWRPGQMAAEMGRCLVKKNAKSQWIDAILDILETPARANSLSARNRSVFTVERPLLSQNLLWSGLLSR